MTHSGSSDSAQRRWKSFTTFGGGAAPTASMRADFKRHSLMLAGPVPIAIQNAFAAFDHDMSRGSDLLFVIDGVVVQCAAEVWAARRIFIGRMGLRGCIR